MLISSNVLLLFSGLLLIMSGFHFWSSSVVLTFKLMKVYNIPVEVSMIMDLVSVWFMFCVSMVSYSIIFFSKYYMTHANVNKRFLALMIIFILSMMLLILSDGYLMLMIGWDGLGLVSFCLVKFYDSSTSLSSSLITIVTNRLGDSALILSSVYFFMNNSLNTNGISQMEKLFAILLLLGVVTKSAQMPFSVWLPAAMAAPTPVSSLVHSSTLVTAGVYLMIRFNYMLVHMKPIVLFTSALTLLSSGLAAINESDMKKLVAMSTLSQMALLAFCISSGLWFMSLMHMLFHSFFKSMLFLSVGSLILEGMGSQDSRFSQKLWLNKIVHIPLIISLLCLMGFPFLLGFFSKDLVLQELMSCTTIMTYIMFFAGCVLTIIYSAKMLSNIVSFNNSSSLTVASENFHWAFNLPVLFSVITCLFSGNIWMTSVLETQMIRREFDVIIGITVILIGLTSKTPLKMLELLTTNKAPNFVKMDLWLEMGFTSWTTKHKMVELSNEFNMIYSEISWLDSFHWFTSLTQEIASRLKNAGSMTMNFTAWITIPLLFIIV